MENVGIFLKKESVEMEGKTWDTEIKNLVRVPEVLYILKFWELLKDYTLREGKVEGLVIEELIAIAIAFIAYWLGKKEQSSVYWAEKELPILGSTFWGKTLTLRGQHRDDHSPEWYPEISNMGYMYSRTPMIFTGERIEF